jgi:hypothetical protein
MHPSRLVAFGRCAVLRTAQWALDGRANSVSISDFRNYLSKTALDMVKGAQELREAVDAAGRYRTIVLQRSAAGMEDDDRLKSMRAPKLVVTSPPYPGIHILYHRWQVDGRKEAPLPFMIANKLDGAGGSYYTMGDRKNPGCQSARKTDPLSASNIDPSVARVVTEGGRSPTGVTTRAAS